MYFNKLKGTLIGHALGDALGAPHESKYNSKLTYTGKLQYNIRSLSKYQGEKIYPIGSVTDDTYMTITLANQLIIDQQYNKNNIILAYEKWANSYSRLGVNTRALFKGVKTVRGYQTRYDKQFNKLQEQWTQSNGSLMRCSPLVIFPEYITNGEQSPLVEDIRLTNPHPINSEVGIVYMFILRTLLLNDELPLYENLLNFIVNPLILEVIDDVKNKRERDISNKSIKGWVITALYCGLYAIYNFDNYYIALEWIINKKGDTDTNAAVYGALYGAKYGYKYLYELNPDNIDILLKTNTILQNIDYIADKLNSLM